MSVMLIENKVCTKCGAELPATSEYFRCEKRVRSGLQAQCRTCDREYNRARRQTNEYKEREREYQRAYGQTEAGKISCQKKCEKFRRSEHGKEYRRNYKQEYYHTIDGYLRNIYAAIKQRCNNSWCRAYKNYGGRGIKCLFTSDEFVDYAMNDSGFDTYEKIKGMEIHRIDNDGHYEEGNIEFLVRSEHAARHRELKVALKRGK